MTPGASVCMLEREKSERESERGGVIRERGRGGRGEKKENGGREGGREGGRVRAALCLPL